MRFEISEKRCIEFELRIFEITGFHVSPSSSSPCLSPSSSLTLAQTLRSPLQTASLFPSLSNEPYSYHAAKLNVPQSHHPSSIEEEERRQSGEKGRMVLSTNWERNEDEKKICAALEKVAKEVGTPHITSGEYISGVYSIGTALINRCSRPSILHAKGTVCVPNCRGEET